MKDHKARAAVVFSDRALCEMLTAELRHTGFSITDENNADLILTEAEFLPYVPGNKMTVAFMPEDQAQAKSMNVRADAVFPYIFSAEKLEITLRKMYSELIIGREKPRAAEKKLEDQNGEPVITALSDGKSALVGNAKISLSSNEWTLLSMLCKAREEGRSVSREELGEAIGHGEGEGGNIVDVYICRLRKKIEMPIGRRLIFTVRGSGYSLVKKNGG